MKTSTPQAAANRGRMRRLAGAVWAQEWCELAWFDLAHSSGVDRTIVYRESLPGPPLMSAWGHKLPPSLGAVVSALPPKAAAAITDWRVR